MDGSGGAAGDRLWAQAARLRLLLGHLAGPALRERVDLDDLVQETFLRVLSSPGGLPPRAAPVAPVGSVGSVAQALRADGGEIDTPDVDLWRLLVHVARHVVVDVARAARAAKRGGRRSGARATTLARADWSQAGLGVSRLAALTAGPATRAIGHEMEARIERSFLALPAEHRRVLALRQLQGLSAEEAGARMGRSATAVHSLYRRALLAWDAAIGDAAPQRREP